MAGKLENSTVTAADLVDLLTFVLIEVAGATTRDTAEADELLKKVADGLDKFSLQCTRPALAGLTQFLASNLKDTE